jgi:hypothetical protein
MTRIWLSIRVDQSFPVSDRDAHAGTSLVTQATGRGDDRAADLIAPHAPAPRGGVP